MHTFTALTNRTTHLPLSLSFLKNQTMVIIPARRAKSTSINRTYLWTMHFWKHKANEILVHEHDAAIEPGLINIILQVYYTAKRDNIVW